ncbi:hypothetical protein ACIGHN_13400 [Acidovorax sp. NPDC077693]|uniref:hypothetical protein n=1 Tax=unclassified Acidovorax TaxID=2684926 RepID=UPI0037CA2B31
MSTQPHIVKFLKPWRGYNTGEVAGFDPDVVETLKAGKVVEDYDPEQGGKKPAQPRKPESTGKRATGKTAGTEQAPDSSNAAPGSDGNSQADGQAGADGKGTDGAPDGQGGNDNDQRP